MDTEVVVVGGGVAGLQAALTLGRMRVDVVVLDTGRPANAPAHAVGGLLGAHDLAPLDLLATGRAQLAELPSVRVLDVGAARVDADRSVTLADGTTLAAREVVLATGADHAVPDVPGLRERWGTSVIHCPFCHGWEWRDRRIALLAAGAGHAQHVVPLLRRLAAAGAVDVHTQIAALHGDGDGGPLREVELPDGRRVPCDVLVVAAPPRLRVAAFAHLGLARATGDADGPLEVGPAGETAVRGIRAAGDLVTAAPAVAQALASGQRAAVGAVRSLLL